MTDFRKAPCDRRNLSLTVKVSQSLQDRLYEEATRQRLPVSTVVFDILDDTLPKPEVKEVEL